MYKITIPLNKQVFPEKTETMAEIHQKAFHMNLDRCLKLVDDDPDKIIPDAIKRLYPEWQDKAWSSATKEYFSIYHDHVKDNSNNLLIATPKILDSFVQEETSARERISQNFFYRACPQEYEACKDKIWNYWKELLKWIFNYKKFTIPNADGWCAGKFIECLGVHACCYCNADLIYSQEFKEKGMLRYRSSLDHFYPQDKYPYLALSLHNLVPACERCNSKFKKESDPIGAMALLNPYQESISQYFQFVFAPASASAGGHFLPKGRAVPLAKPGKLGLVKPHLRTFCIDEVYNDLYGFVVQDVMTKVRLLDTGYGKWLARKLHSHGGKKLAHSLPTAFWSELQKEFRDDWKHLLFDLSFSSTDINKRPFSKLIMDLAGYL